MPFGPLQRPTMPEHRDGQGSHAGAWEPGRVISFLEIALIACGSSGQQTVVVAAKQGCGF
jgi:hypothetical protein